MNEFVAAGGAPREEGTTVLAQSALCKTAFDLHLYPLGHRNPDGSWTYAVYVAVMDPRSIGTVRLSGSDPEALPVIDHGYFTDEGDVDLDVLADGVRLARQLAVQTPIASLAGAEIDPLKTGDELKAHIRRHGAHDYHPVGTCKMGPASDATAVVDASGEVHGVAGLFVGDASIMPAVPRANTNIPAAVVGEKIADLLIERLV
jgi:choline dehydrogenase